ncbi:unnamed protein product [Meloidogyne enterolobii]|uniref:Uncharacterized protein n=1 Tax=Meloidogyne enterolobii TaxID=390850 RepID=A0ACB1A559_MELEN
MIVSQLMIAGYNCAPLHEGIEQDDRDFTFFHLKTRGLILYLNYTIVRGPPGGGGGVRGSPGTKKVVIL